MKDEDLVIGGRKFASRLFLGTGKFPSEKIMRDALAASGASIVTVALRRANLSAQPDPHADIADWLEPDKYMILPNTSGAVDASEAVRLARLGEAAGFGKFVKLEIHPDPNYLLPDPVETLSAAQTLAAEGFKVMAYINADPVLALRLQEAGVAAVMPLGAPIGTNRGVETLSQIRIMIEQCDVPVVVDAGIGMPSHAAQAMEAGAAAVMVNTAVATAADCPAMAAAFAKAVEAGRTAYLAASGAKFDRAVPTSPLTGFLD
ncbi:MAG: thiazole synthase [Verrucomicrobia bacterium]|nr:MAG: thiazole synthase [Verrucomicrobiota bacterium]